MFVCIAGAEREFDFFCSASPRPLPQLLRDEDEKEFRRLRFASLFALARSPIALLQLLRLLQLIDLIPLPPPVSRRRTSTTTSELNLDLYLSRKINKKDPRPSVGVPPLPLAFRRRHALLRGSPPLPAKEDLAAAASEFHRYEETFFSLFFFSFVGKKGSGRSREALVGNFAPQTTAIIC